MPSRCANGGEWGGTLSVGGPGPAGGVPRAARPLPLPCACRPESEPPGAAVTCAAACVGAGAAAAAGYSGGSASA